MKQFFLVVIFLLTILFFNFPAVAQAPPPVPPIPGLNCGNIGDKCCVNPTLNTNITIPRPNIIGIDQLVGVLEGLANSIIKPVIEPFAGMTQQFMEPCLSGTPSTPGDLNNPSCSCILPAQAPLTALSQLCNNLSPSEQNDCVNNLKKGAVWTAVGPIYGNVKDFIQNTLLSWGISLAGIIALLCIIYSAFQLQTSRGNPEGIKKAQERLTSCVIGLMLIIFSVFILRIIGVDILRIPGFGK